MFSVSLALSPAVALEAPPVPIVTETLQQKAERIAVYNNISTTTFATLIDEESRWKVDAYNEGSEARGLVQISRVWHPEVTDECAFDPECSMNWAVQRIKDGYIDEWQVCNCYSYTRSFFDIKTFPKMTEIQPNSKPVAGGVAIFTYKGKRHIAYIKSVKEGILSLLEANYSPCSVSPREVSVDDKAYMGTWVP